MSIIKANKWQDVNGSAYQTIVQVVQTMKRTQWSTTASGTTAITGLAASITPKFSNSKILIMYSCNYDQNRPNSGGGFRITKNTNLLEGFMGDADGSKYRVNADFGRNTENDQSLMHRTGMYLDDAGSTSLLTYQMCVWKDGGYTFWLNKGAAADGADDPITTSHIILMEVLQ